MENQNQVKRNLKQRHITMIALGGTIGTGRSEERRVGKECRL